MPTVPSTPSGAALSTPADASTTPATEARLDPRAPGSTSRVTATTPLARPIRQRVGLHRFGRTALVLGGLVATLAVTMLVSL
ncbi:MAG TPA: hypothetical protein VKF37_11750, partial [Chloroflexota bacterium]|nr:hypothetical protein [Chloroflexota bacterium]